MAFSSLIFLYIFLPLALLCCWLAPNQWKNAVLLGVSLLFFAWGQPKGVLLLLVSLILNHYGGLWLERQSTKRSRRMALAAGVAGNLLLLCLQYPAFTVRNSPVIMGLSLCTLQGISYQVDIYRREVRAQGSFITYGTYAAMFPKMVAGPLTRYGELRGDLARQSFSGAQAVTGFERFIVGLSKKVLLADRMSELRAQIQAASQPGAAVAWVGLLAFSLEFIFTLSGCSDMAVGLGKMLGFRLPENVNYPFSALSLKDFWQRWNVTLFAWLRDYIYRPLGGSRNLLRRIAATLLCAVLGGLWYGRKGNLLLFGLYSGLMLLGEHFLWGRTLEKAPKPLRRTLTMITVLLGWVFFSAESAPDAFRYFGCLLGLHGLEMSKALYLVSCYWLILLLCLLLAGKWMYLLLQKLEQRFPRLKKALSITVALLLLCCCTACLLSGSPVPSWITRI
ncbi:MAG: hypothetical protein PUC47_11855 [Oscillospiraceae bacterium]|nr:hypothetical protein [Oscillospiraceae bacterium]